MEGGIWLPEGDRKEGSAAGCELGRGNRPRNCGAEQRQQGYEQWHEAVSRSVVAFSGAR